MGKGKRIREQKMSKQNPPDPMLLKAQTIAQSIVGLSNAHYTRDGRLTINISRETRRDNLQLLTSELAKVGITANYAYPKTHRNGLIVAAEPVTEDHIDDINQSTSTVQVDIDVDKLMELKSKYEYSIKFDDYSLIMTLPFDDIRFSVAGSHNYHGRIILNKDEINQSIKDLDQSHKVWGPNIIGYAILYDNETNPDEWIIGAPIHMCRTYKNNKGISYQLYVSVTDGIFAVSNDYEVRKKFRYTIIESTTIYTPELFKGMTGVWNAIVRAITDPDMKDQWHTEQVTNKDGSILTKYTNIGSIKNPNGVMLMNPIKHKSFIEKIDASYTQSEIITTKEKFIEIVNKYTTGDILSENEVDVYMKSPYDDFILAVDEKCYRIIIDKEKIKSVTKPYMYNRNYSEPVGMIIADSNEYPEYTIFGVLSFEKFLGNSDVFKLTINAKLGLSIYEHDESKLNEFQKSVQPNFGIKDSTEILSFITLLPTIIKALNDPEVKEIWDTQEINISDDPHSTRLVSDKKPLENIKRIYMCEHQPVGRELERHTDKWYVRGHEVHRKNGKVFFRKGHYKGPGREDPNNKPEPRKRVINTFGNSLDKEDLDEFYNLLK